ncbi:MAG TPA: helix-turn-helix domain-containing protein [Actinomycetota bacterium]
MRKSLTSIRPLAALDDKLRQRIYLLVRSEGRPVTREEVAREVGISRKLAAFHLDKLLERGLLDAHYARPPGRSGPGAGRSSKMYRPSELELQVLIPERRYDLLGELLVEAIEHPEPGESAHDAAIRAAADRGRALGDDIRRREGLRPPGAERALSVTASILEEHGFEPYRNGSDEIALRNCPFRTLATGSPELVCEMNQAFVEGLVRGLGNERVEAVLTRRPGDCCVSLRAPT